MADPIPLRDPTGPAGSGFLVPDPPDHFSAEALELWGDIITGWRLGPEATPLLRAALESLDLREEARRLLEDEGITTTNPDSGHAHVHPAWRVFKDADTSFRANFRALGLEPPEVI